MNLEISSPTRPHRRIKVLVNATTIVKGGGIQVAAEFLFCIASNPNSKCLDWVVAMSKEVAEAANSRGIALPNESTIISPSPAKSRDSRSRLIDIENASKPDCVFTVFGPAYVRFSSKHLMGVADGWVTHAGPYAYWTLKSPVVMARVLLLCLYKGYQYRKADSWVVEAECARAGFARRYLIPKTKISVIPNNCGSHYQNGTSRREASTSSCVSVLTFASPYTHKRLDLIPKVAAILKKTCPEIRVLFHVTIPEGTPARKAFDEATERLGVQSSIRHLGHVPVGDGPAVYRKMDIAFQPTVLETSSASYPEAMAMGVPIVTSDLSFARDACHDAAIYFQAGDPQDAASKIRMLVIDRELRKQLSARGSRLQSGIMSPDAKFLAMIELLYKTASHCGSNTQT